MTIQLEVEALRIENARLVTSHLEISLRCQKATWERDNLREEVAGLKAEIVRMRGVIAAAQLKQLPQSIKQQLTARGINDRRGGIKQV